MELAVQQLQLRDYFKTQASIEACLEQVKQLGIHWIELNQFMLQPYSFKLKMLMQLSGMGGGLRESVDWPALLTNRGFQVLSLHTSLPALEQDFDGTVQLAQSLGTKRLVLSSVTGFDFRSSEEAKGLIQKLNAIGDQCHKEGLQVYYHNHNREFTPLDSGQSFMDLLIRESSPQTLPLELDVYWLTDAGLEVISSLQKWGDRIQLLHLTDRMIVGNRFSSPIGKSLPTEIGKGTMPYQKIFDQMKQMQLVGACIETHSNWLDKNGLRSLETSLQGIKQLGGLS